MKIKSALKSVLIGLLTVLALVGFSPSATCADRTTWTGDGNGNDWFQCENWNNGCPDSSKDAFINNGHKAEINRPGATARSLTLGESAADSGTVSVDGTQGGRLDVLHDAYAGAIYVGYGGRGTLSITNGGRVASGEAYIAALGDGPGGEVNSNGAVTVSDDSTWTMLGPSARLFIGGTGTNDGGTALLNVARGGTVVIDNAIGTVHVTVGISGTLTGDGYVMTQAAFDLGQMEVKGTLAPSGTLHLDSNLRMFRSATMLCSVTPEDADNVDLGLGYALLDGRLSVIMTGTYTPGADITLLYAYRGFNNTQFQSESIKYPVGQCFTPVVSYGTRSLRLYLRPECR